MKHLTPLYALCMLVATLTLHSADVSAITFPVKSDLYVGAGPMSGALNLDIDSRPSLGAGFSMGGNFKNINLQGSIHYDIVHDRLLDFAPANTRYNVTSANLHDAADYDSLCHWRYTLAAGYSFHLFQHFSATPQVGLQWHSGSDFKCDNPRAIGALRLHYAFNKHWGIANGIESDFKDTWADYLHLVYTF